MNKLDSIKLGSNIAATAGTIHIVSNIVSTLVPRRNVIERTLAFVGSLAVGSLLADVTRTHVEKRIDEVVTWLDQNAKK